MSKEEILRVVVESMPEKSVTWIDVLSSLLKNRVRSLILLFNSFLTN
jgi:hypothetical protein